MKNIDKFKKSLEKSLILDHKEKELFALIPDSHWEKIFSRNFNSDVKLANRILFNEFDQVEEVDLPKLEEEKLAKEKELSQKKYYNSVKSIKEILLKDKTNIKN